MEKIHLLGNGTGTISDPFGGRFFLTDKRFFFTELGYHFLETSVFIRNLPVFRKQCVVIIRGDVCRQMITVI